MNLWIRWLVDNLCCPYSKKYWVCVCKISSCIIELLLRFETFLWAWVFSMLFQHTGKKHFSSAFYISFCLMLKRAESSISEADYTGFPDVPDMNNFIIELKLNLLRLSNIFPNQPAAFLFCFIFVHYIFVCVYNTIMLKDSMINIKLSKLSTSECRFRNASYQNLK